MMRLKIESLSKEAKKLKEKFINLALSVESENWESGELTLVSTRYIIINFYILTCKLLCLCYYLDSTY